PVLDDLGVALGDIAIAAATTDRLQHLGIDRARTHAVDPHIGRERDRKLARHVDDAALRHAIERLHAAAPAEPQDRSYIDDIAVRSAERRQRIARAEEGRAQIDGDDPLPIIRRRLLETLAAVDPGIVDEDVETVERRDRFLDDALAFIDAREI